jgi:hypothetical protein
MFCAAINTQLKFSIDEKICLLLDRIRAQSGVLEQALQLGGLGSKTEFYILSRPPSAGLPI